MPIETDVHPEPEVAEACLRALVEDIDVISGPKGWAKFDAYSSILRFVYPAADFMRLTACGLWIVGLFLIDDLFDESDVGREGREEATQRAWKFIQQLKTDVPDPELGALGKIATILREKLLDLQSQSWYDALVESAEKYLFQGVIPGMALRESSDFSLEEYVAAREHDSAVQTCLDLIELANSFELPAADRKHPLIVEMRQHASLHVALVNDIVSYEKEIKQSRDPMNLVVLLHRRSMMSVRDALSCVVDLSNRHMASFLVAQEKLFADPPSQEAVLFVHGMRAWLRGNLDWSLVAGRYLQESHPLAEMRPSALPARIESYPELGPISVRMPRD